MEYIGSFEAKTHLPQLLARVANGEEFIITKHGKPMAKLVSFGATPKRRDVASAVAAMKQFRKDRNI